jgi:hypothetical protein
VALGLISYGVYLYHWPIDVVVNESRVGYTGWPLFLTQTTITLALAIASYFAIELPIRRGAISGVAWRRLGPAIAFGVVLVLFIATFGARSPVATPPKLPTLAAAKAYAAAPAGSRRILLVGNSVAYALGPSFHKVRSDPPLSVFNAGLPACMFPPNVTAPPVVAGGQRLERAPCHEPWEADVVKAFRPDVVLWLVSDAANSGLKYQGRSVRACGEPFDSIYKQSLRREIAALRSHGATVVITTEAYPRYIGADLDRPTDCDNRLRREVAAETGTQLIDLAGYICPDGRCRVKQDGVTLRPDGQHYYGPGGDIVATWLVQQLRLHSSGS